MALPATPQPPNALQAIKSAAKANGVDWRAMASIAQHESGLRPDALGDNGTSAGLFQLHRGGALPGNVSIQQAQNPAWNANFAARQIKGLGIGGTMPVEEQIRQIASRFERPANVAGEQQAALGYYRTRYSGLPALQPQTATVAPPGGQTQTAAAQPTLQSALPTLQASFGVTQRTNQNALDALGKISGRQVQAAAAPDLASLMPSLTGVTAQSSKTPQTIDVPLKGKTPHAAEADPHIAKVVQLARHFIGTPYVWGGAKPGGFDCSGLLQYVWGKNGVKIPRTSEQQWHAGVPVNKSDVQPGDAVFFVHSDGDVGHVGMAIGGGRYIQAPHTGDHVKVSNLADASNFIGARRFT